MPATSVRSARWMLTFGLLVGCAPPKAAQPYPSAKHADTPATPSSEPSRAQPASVGKVTYFEREIDLAPFLAGYPYQSFRPKLETDKLFFIEIGDTYSLRMLDLEGANPWSLSQGRSLSDVDWSKRSLWSVHHHAPSQTLWLHADARNDEQMNLWTLGLPGSAHAGELVQVTEHDYVYGYGFSEDERQIAYLPRHGEAAPYRTCLNLLDVATKANREIVCDTAELTFTWSDLRFSPDGKEVYFRAQIRGDRNRVQLVRVDLSVPRPKVEVLTDPKVARTQASALEGWVGDSLLFIANDDGFDNLYAFDRETGRIRQLTRFREDLASAELSRFGVVGVHKTPAGSTLVLIDPKDGKTLATHKFSGEASVLGAHGDRAIVRHEAPDVVFEAFTLRLRESGFTLERVAGLPPELEQQIVACEAESVQIPTFDTDAQTGKQRLLHAFLLRPKRPVSDRKHALALITAFYGGRNRYQTLEHVLCAAGLTVLSPAVRGSDGFGRVFKALNDKDLGGDEIVDLFWAARWLQAQTELPARRIGVYGGSHGGYATMRALTFVPTTNGRNEFFPFGFGLSHAGFSDIESFHGASNIPDWVVLESGDPAIPDERAKMKDRSPLTHVGRLSAPILLTHGSNDWRVPVEESRRFAEAAQALDRPVTYVEFEGQGHHIEGLSLQARLYQTRFDFLQAVARAAPTERDTAKSPTPTTP